MEYGIVYHQSNLNRKDRLEIKKPYISSPIGWGLDGGSKRIYRATNLRYNSKYSENEPERCRFKLEHVLIIVLNRDGEMKNHHC
jgi:hypothetical protein